MRNLIGVTLNKYQILMKIRETGTRILFKAYDTKLYKYVGLDVIKIQISDREKLIDQLRKQARKNAELVHSNIATLLDFGVADDIIFFVYNFQPVHSLRPLFNRKYSWQELSQELIPVTQALTFAHLKGVHHAFLNPISIVVNGNKNPILFDFGVEQIISSHITSSSPGSWINTWGMEYRSPEQMSGAGLDHRSDIYAIGMILHEWVSGEIAFLDEIAIATLRKRKEADVKDINLERKIPSAIHFFIQKCIAANPSDRFQTMQEVSTIMARGALDLPITQKMVENPLLILSEKKSPIRWGVILVSAMLSLVVLSLLIWNWTAPVELVEQTISVVNTPVRITKTPVTTSLLATPTIPSEEGQDVASVEISYPIFQEFPIPDLLQQTQAENAEQIINVGIWGMGNVNRLASSSHGSRFAVASSIGVFIYDSRTLELQKQLDTRSWVSAVEFSPDGTLMAAGDRDGLIRLWETNHWQEVASYSGHNNGILDIAFSPEGDILASVALDNTLVRWEIKSGGATTSTSVSVPAVNRIEFSVDGRTIITGGNDFKINLWDAKDLGLKGTVTLSSKVVDMAVVSDSGHLAVGGADQKITIVDIASSLILARLDAQRVPLSSLATSPDGGYFASGDVRGGISVWNKDGESLWILPAITENIESTRPLDSPHNLVFSADGKSLISVLRDGRIRVFDASTGGELLSDQSRNLRIQKIEISPDSRYALSQDLNAGLKVWDLDQGKILYELQGQIKQGGLFSPDGRLFAVATDSSTVKVFVLANGSERYTFNKHKSIETIQFINNGSQLVTGNKQSIRLWSISSGQELQIKRSFSGNGCTSIDDLNDKFIFYITEFNYVFQQNSSSDGLCSFQKQQWMKSLFISEANKQAAYGGSSKLSVVSLQSKIIREIDMEGVNRRNIVSVAIHPGGNLLAAAYDDHTIHLWDIATQREIMLLYGHDDDITDLQFTPDGKLLLSTSLDGTIRLWGVPD